MGIAALVLGIIGLFLSFIPVVNIIFFIPVIVGFVLGIVDTVLKTKKKEPRGMAISGIVLTSIAMVISIFMNLVTFIAVIGLGTELIDSNYDKIKEEIEDYDYEDYEDYDYDFEEYEDYTF